MALSEIQIKNAKAAERPYKLADGEGLFLLVKGNGSKLWRLKYRYRGKEKLLSFGAYPDVGIAAARELKTLAKAALAEGKDPMVHKPVEISSQREPSKLLLRCGTRIERAASIQLMRSVSGLEWNGTCFRYWAKG